ncbi:unnamed protein product [Lepeophtheirus salmonis]|uniref:(salmon louse) hypothetical protein n=2 Tax=Lepeophtheirus salmonis TaxID=72036 RepID=A0A7R8H270_LEPSM|nr:unnamed protein product [Lepeophtheirus salmonis]CAF2808318.1 unnamed protein product [Lepeophtheirus salmonis]
MNRSRIASVVNGDPKEQVGGDTEAPEEDKSSSSSSSSWLQKALIGRTPSLPSSLGKRKQSFLKKLQSRKISAPSFALRTSPSSNIPSLSTSKKYSPLLNGSNEDKGVNSGSHHHQNPSSFTIGSGHSSSCSSINQSRSATPDTRRRCFMVRQDTTRSHSPATPPIESGGNGWFLGSEKSLPPPPTPMNFENLDEAGAFVEELRSKYRIQGSQLVLYKKKLRQQKNELSTLRINQKHQLEEITSQLILFESCLRKKEKQLEETLHMKNQVILKQQRVIKHLIKKERDVSRDLEGCYESGVIRSSFSGSGSDVTQSEPIVSLRRLSTGAAFCNNIFSSLANHPSPSYSSIPISDSNNESIARSDPEFECQNDSDSAIFVSLSVPNLLTTTNLNNSALLRSSNTNSSSSPMTITSDDSTPRKKKRIAGRHSGFLKRPEILETVYSVEEDAEKQNESTSNENKENLEEKNLLAQMIKPLHAPSATASSNQSRSNNKPFSSSNALVFRSRFDSDVNVSDPELSTDDESNRIFFSETDISASCCTCSRRSSYCYCSSRTGSRRSSYGSHANLSSILAQGDDDKVNFYNRVMTNHKSVLKPKDVKFKRINKSKSKSLEELRGKLRSQILERASLEKETSPSAQLPMSNKKTGFRGIFKHSVSLDQGS